MQRDFVCIFRRHHLAPRYPVAIEISNMVLGRVERNPRSWEKELDERDLPIWETLRSSAIFGAYSGLSSQYHRFALY